MKASCRTSSEHRSLLRRHPHVFLNRYDASAAAASVCLGIVLDLLHGCSTGTSSARDASPSESTLPETLKRA